MPELLEFQEVIESHPIVLAIACAAAAIVGAIVTRWVDRRTLRSADERLTVYEEEVRRLNDERADMLTRLEERGDEVRRARAELARLVPATGATASPWQDPARPEAPRRDVPGPGVAPGVPQPDLPGAGVPGPTAPGEEVYRPAPGPHEVAAPQVGWPDPRKPHWR